MVERTASRLAWTIQNAAAPAADIYLYDIIGDPWEGTTSADFVQELSAVTASRINLHVNSPGGYVNDGLAMYNALLAHPAEVFGYVEGSADSAASFVLQAADRRFIARNSSMMIHLAQGFVMGDEIDMQAAATRFTEESRNIASIYAERAGGSVEDWIARMSAGEGVSRGTTYRGQAAVDVGLADEVTAAPARAAARRLAALSEGRITALSEYDIPESTDIGRALREGARFDRAAPSLEQLLGHLADEPLSAAIKLGAK